MTLVIYCKECKSFEVMFQSKFVDTGEKAFRFRCRRCGRKTPYYESFDKAMKGWENGEVDYTNTD